MSPYLLLGFLFAGILHVLVPKKFFRNYLSQENFRSVFLSALFGVPLPLCSCGVIPTAMSLRREGVSKGATIAFLTATPQTGIDSILATYAVLGLSFAVMRPIAALATALMTGLVATRVFKKKPDIPEFNRETCRMPENEKGRKWLNIFKYGYVTMLQDIGLHLIVGLILAGIITVAVPDAFLLRFADHPLLEMIAVLLVSIPMYVCATGSIPIAAALMLKGLSPGAALVFLMAGPATNMAAIMVIRKVMGNKSLWLYLLGIITGAMCFGLIIDTCMPAEWFQPQSRDILSAHAATPWWKWAATTLLLLLLFHALIRKYIDNHKKSKIAGASVSYKISGMKCNHCKDSVETNVRKIKGVKEASVNLDKGELTVVGEVPAEQIQQMVESLGYEFKGLRM